MRDWLKAHLVFKRARMSDLRVYNRYLACKDTLALDRVYASNDRLNLKGGLRLRGQDRSDSSYAQWRVLSAGLELQGQHLVRVRLWYGAQPPSP